MSRFFGIARDNAGNTITSATVTVFAAGTSSLATIYSNTGLSTPKANPFTAGADGTYDFYVSPGEFKIRVEKMGFTTFEQDYIQVGHVLDHGGLTGLGDDDHAQYALLAGRGAGQTLNGGVNSGGNLTLVSTIHATKGSILFGNSSAYSEANIRLGIGTAGPLAKLHANGAGNTNADYTNGDALSAALYIQDSGGGGGNGGQIVFGAAQGVFAGIKGYLLNGLGPAGDLILQTRATTGNVLSTLRLKYTGELEVPRIHNNGGNGANASISSGTYTPTLTGVSNVAATTSLPCQWLRVGQVVIVTGQVFIDPTLTAYTSFRMSLPVPSALTSAEQLAGGGAQPFGGGAIPTVSIFGDSTNDQAFVEVIPQDAVNRPITVMFMYRVL